MTTRLEKSKVKTEYLEMTYRTILCVIIFFQIDHYDFSNI